MHTLRRYFSNIFKGSRPWAKRAPEALTPGQRRRVAAAFPLYERLPDAVRDRLDDLALRFARTTRWVGRDGLAIDEAMRLTVAVQACLMIVNKPDARFRGLKTVILYPSAFASRQARSEDGYVVTEGRDVRLGESWMRGPVVLSWPDAEHGASVPDDGVNVVVHEFAHQLDAQTGVVDGAPLLDRDHDAGAWARTFSAAFERLREAVKDGRETAIDPYGAEAPEEFFAVAAELFFERPEDLQAEEPEVYAHLARYFRLDPAAWPPAPADEA
ncbi:MAG: M90 family metallopeptidase [Pseudomonadota bacterium]